MYAASPFSSVSSNQKKLALREVMATHRNEFSQRAESARVELQDIELTNEVIEAQSDAAKHALKAALASGDPDAIAKAEADSADAEAHKQAAADSAAANAEADAQNATATAAEAALASGDPDAIAKAEADSADADAQNTTATAAASTRAPTCSQILFLRIQKTGSGTLNKILNTQCVKHLQVCSSYYHLDYGAISYQIKHSRIPTCALTFLRDPAERFLSEFQMALTQANSAATTGWPFFTQNQWDYSEKDRNTIFLMLKREDLDQTTKAQLYLNFPRSASQNRQALYLLGFPRVGCGGVDPAACNPDCLFTASSDTFDRCQQHSICATTFKQLDTDARPRSPGAYYNWSHPAMLAQAKQNLESLTTFGIVECFHVSLRVMGKALDWDEDAVSKQSIRNVHTADLELQKWVATLPKSFMDEIRVVNQIDQQLYDYALQLFGKRFGDKVHHECMAAKMHKLTSKLQPSHKRIGWAIKA